ncbi:MAG: tRNA (N(6)-L-threonylcarbamoyladenosine(37)-C(2))-methylthiotransferase MtaB [Candidatus Scatovivens sp.]
MKVAFYTLGCKVNQYETNGMIQKFQEKGYEIVDFEDIADIYIINTCTVTNIADRKSRQFLRHAKKNNPNAIVVAVGCYVKVGREKLERIPEISLCLDNDNKINIVERVEELINKSKIKDNCKNDIYNDFGDVTYTEKNRAVIKVQDGCDMFCSYCIIPYARGRVMSRKPENIISEITKIADNGIKEVVITGIHVASYGKDFNVKYDLIDLLSEINNIKGIERIRIGSIEPKLFSDENLIRISKIPKLVHHFHLSLQSGCTDTLKRMNRKYTAEEFEVIVNNIRKLFKDVILTTDIIVGFPGETEKEFNSTYEFLKKIKFYKMHVFKYSEREGTVASKMLDKVSSDIKEKRSNILLELSDINEKEYLEKYIGKKVSVLFEEEKDGMYQGHTDNFLLVKVKSKENLVNKILDVNIVNREGLELIGILK